MDGHADSSIFIVRCTPCATLLVIPYTASGRVSGTALPLFFLSRIVLRIAGNGDRVG
jgi:hypothetical protein